MNKTSYLLITIFVFLIGTTDIQAEYSVAPLRFEFQTEAGKIGSGVITIRNPEEKPVSVKLYARDFLISPDGSESELEAGSIPRSCAEWLTISPTEVDLAAGSTIKVRVNVDVPLDAKGNFWAMIFVEETSKPKAVERKVRGRNIGETYSFQVNVKQRWGVRVYEDVPGTETFSAEITGMNVIQAQEDQPFKIAVEFSNSGNTLLRCTGHVEIRDENGVTVQDVQLGKSQIFTVFPESNRHLLAEIVTQLLPGTYIALAIIDFGYDDLAGGELEFAIE